LLTLRQNRDLANKDNQQSSESGLGARGSITVGRIDSDFLLHLAAGWAIKCDVQLAVHTHNYELLTVRTFRHYDISHLTAQIAPHIPGDVVYDHSWL
jgi:hypothetical protein